MASYKEKCVRPWWICASKWCKNFYNKGFLPHYIQQKNRNHRYYNMGVFVQNEV